MSRHWFGRSLTDWTMTLGTPTVVGETTTAEVSAAGPATVTFWSAPVGGAQYTDLLDASGTPVTEISSSDGSDGMPVGTIPELQGPEGVTEMWADAEGARAKMVATDLGADVVDIDARVATLESDAANFLDAPAWVRRNPSTGAWPARPDTPRWVIWVDTLPETPSPPPIGGTGMADGLDMYWGVA